MINNKNVIFKDKYPNMSVGDIEELERFRTILRNGFSADPWARVGGKPNWAEPNLIDVDMDDTIKSESITPIVEIITELYNTPTNAVEKLIEASSDNPEIAEALNTTKLDDGIIIGKWKICARLVGSGKKQRKQFDIINTLTKKTVVKMLCIYEAALAIVRYLNNGKHISSQEIQNVLQLEKSFYAHRTDSINYNINMIRALKRNDEEKAFVLETRKKDAIVKALQLEKEIQCLADSALCNPCR